MKVFAIQPKSVNFGEIDSGNGPYFDKRDSVSEFKAKGEGKVLTKEKLEKFEYQKKLTALRKNKLEELTKTIEGKNLNFFQKIGYAIKKAKVNIMTF